MYIVYAYMYNVLLKDVCQETALSKALIFVMALDKIWPKCQFSPWTRSKAKLLFWGLQPQPKLQLWWFPVQDDGPTATFSRVISNLLSFDPNKCTSNACSVYFHPKGIPRVCSKTAQQCEPKTIIRREIHSQSCTSDGMQDPVVDDNVGSLYMPHPNSFSFHICLILGWAFRLEFRGLWKPKILFSLAFILALSPSLQAEH